MFWMQGVPMTALLATAVHLFVPCLFVWLCAVAVVDIANAYGGDDEET